MIKVKDLKCEYVNGNSNQILFENVNFEIKDGDFVIITGPSGSGKTSLLKILSGHQKPNNGEVYWDEQNIYNLKEKIFNQLNKQYRQNHIIHRAYELGAFGDSQRCPNVVADGICRNCSQNIQPVDAA